MKKIIRTLTTICLCLSLAFCIHASSDDWRDDFISKYGNEIENEMGNDKCKVIKSTDMDDYVYMIFSDSSLSSTVVSVVSGDQSAIEAYREFTQLLDAYASMYYIFMLPYNKNGYFSVNVLNPLDANKILYTNVNGETVYDALAEFTGTENSQTPTETPTEAPAETPSAETYDLDLTAGHYIGGLGIPTGYYTLTWVANSGNVYSPMKVNEIFREEKTTVYNNYDFSAGTELNVSGSLVLHIHTDNADFSKVTQREIHNESETVLPPGNYVAGTNFPEGTYFITAYEGHGNVYSHEADVNEILSTEPEAGHSIYQYNYATFETGDSLEVSSCTIKLVPAGD